MSNESLMINSVKSLINTPAMKARFEEILGKKAAGFMSSVINVVNTNAELKKCDPTTVVMAAAIGATLDLPIDPNLGFAAIVPYNNRQKDGTFKHVAQFQIMYRGFIQLGIRTGQYKAMNACEIYEGEISGENRITGEIDFDQTNRTSDKVIGYAAYFKLINGFEKAIYWPIEKVEKHAKRFSKTYAKGYGKWVDDFDSMAKKTVIKALLSKWGILSVDMQKAVIADQGIIRKEDVHDIDAVEYIDNESTSEEPTGQEKVNTLNESLKNAVTRPQESILTPSQAVPSSEAEKKEPAGTSQGKQAKKQDSRIAFDPKILELHSQITTELGNFENPQSAIKEASMLENVDYLGMEHIDKCKDISRLNAILSNLLDMQRTPQTDDQI